MSINSSDIGKVIGKGGSKIRDLEFESGAQIKVRPYYRQNITSNNYIGNLF
jgi:polyribonucleotide nucleotidyltransferase